MKAGEEGYCRFVVGNKKYQRAVVAHVTITRVNGEYIEIIDQDSMIFKIAKDKIEFPVEVK